MAVLPQDVRSQLLASNEQFRKLADQHHAYDEQLQSLATKTYLNDQERVEEVRLKKLKLRLKDEMERIIQDYKREHSHPLAS